MINIDFKQYAKDHQIFGWEYFENAGINDFTGWDYSPYWIDRCWPILHKDDELPRWWINILGFQRL